MKKFTILFAIIAFTFSCISAMAQQSNHRKMTDAFGHKKYSSIENIDKNNASKYFKSVKVQVSKPGNCEQYFWDAFSNTWFHQANTVYSYSETGQLLEELSTEAVSGSNLEKYTFAYDAHGNMTEDIYYYWDLGVWQINWGSKYTYTYDNNGNITEQISQWWDYGTNSWENQWKDIFSYDNNGNFNEQTGQIWENGVWLNEFKDELTVDENGVPTELIQHYWDGSDWIGEEKFTNVVWNNWENWEDSEPESYIMYIMQNGEWVTDERYNATYTGNNYVGIYEYWINGEWVTDERESYSESATEIVWMYEYWENGEWVIDSRDIETFDDHGNFTGYTFEYWENGEWVVSYAYAESHTYSDDDDIIETIYSDWDFVSLSMVNTERKVYSNFQYFETGVNDRTSLTNVNIFPNPVSSSINIQINEADVNYYNVEIINIAGQTVYNNSYSNLSTSINLENFDRGVYILRITADNNKVHNYKLLKE